MAEVEERRAGLRKRRRPASGDNGISNLDRLLSVAEGAQNILVFTGSGLSASSGMSTFSTSGGLYERAQRKHRLADGKTLFTYSFYERHRLEALAFFAEIYGEAVHARPAPGHRALGALMDSRRLQRHYTLNIDGLAERVGMDTWHPGSNPDGATVEMHGNILRLVCGECGEDLPVTAAAVRDMRAKRTLPCPACPADAQAALRFKVMLYEDAEGEVVTPEEVMDLMEADAKAADLILWVGISFQQSASTAYFRKVRHWLQEAGRLERVVQAVVNPCEEALWNLMTASSNQHELNVMEVLASADEVLPLLAAQAVAGRPLPEKALPEKAQPDGDAAAPQVPLAAEKRATSPTFGADTAHSLGLEDGAVEAT